MAANGMLMAAKGIETLYQVSSLYDESIWDEKSLKELNLPSL
jgi:hypothetical protein